MPDLGPFLALAGTVFLDEITPRIDQAQVWATEKDLETVRRRFTQWKHEAGIA